MKFYLIVIITLISMLILAIITFYTVMYIKHQRFANIKGDRPPEPSEPSEPEKNNPDNPIIPKQPYTLSSYKHTLDLSGFPLYVNKYTIICKFNSDYTVFIDMDIFDKNDKQLTTNSFHNNTWSSVENGYNIQFDPNLLNEVSKVNASLNNIIKYVNTDVPYIIVSGKINLIIPFPINISATQCSNINCV
jgi:hypothetical protein